jgi:hypothetical protein
MIGLINKIITILFRNDIEKWISIIKVNTYYMVICVVHIIPKQAPTVVDPHIIGRSLDIYSFTPQLPMTKYLIVQKSLLFIY